MKKIWIIALIILGAVLGYWLSRENQKLFELPMRPAQLQNGKSEEHQRTKRIGIGMDMWQVKEVLGVPLKRRILSEKQGEKKEIWIYGDRQCYFENGFLKELPGD